MSRTPKKARIFDKESKPVVDFVKSNQNVKEVFNAKTIENAIKQSEHDNQMKLFEEFTGNGKNHGKLGNLVAYKQALKNFNEIDINDFICKVEFKKCEDQLSKITAELLKHIDRKDNDKKGIEEQEQDLLKQINDMAEDKPLLKSSKLYLEMIKKYQKKEIKFEEEPDINLTGVQFLEYKKNRYKMLKSGNVNYIEHKRRRDREEAIKAQLEKVKERENRVRNQTQHKIFNDTFHSGLNSNNSKAKNTGFLNNTLPNNSECTLFNLLEAYNPDENTTKKERDNLPEAITSNTDCITNYEEKINSKDSAVINLLTASTVITNAEESFKSEHDNDQIRNKLSQDQQQRRYKVKIAGLMCDVEYKNEDQLKIEHDFKQKYTYLPSAKVYVDVAARKIIKINHQKKLKKRGINREDIIIPKVQVIPEVEEEKENNIEPQKGKNNKNSRANIEGIKHNFLRSLDVSMLDFKTDNINGDDYNFNSKSSENSSDDDDSNDYKIDSEDEKLITKKLKEISEDNMNIEHIDMIIPAFEQSNNMVKQNPSEDVSFVLNDNVDLESLHYEHNELDQQDPYNKTNVNKHVERLSNARKKKMIIRTPVRKSSVLVPTDDKSTQKFKFASFNNVSKGKFPVYDILQNFNDLATSLKIESRNSDRSKSVPEKRPQQYKRDFKISMGHSSIAKDLLSSEESGDNKDIISLKYGGDQADLKILSVQSPAVVHYEEINHESKKISPKPNTNLIKLAKAQMIDMDEASQRNPQIGRMLKSIGFNKKEENDACDNAKGLDLNKTINVSRFLFTEKLDSSINSVAITEKRDDNTKLNHVNDKNQISLNNNKKANSQESKAKPMQFEHGIFRRTMKTPEQKRKITYDLTNDIGGNLKLLDLPNTENNNNISSKISNSNFKGSNNVTITITSDASPAKGSPIIKKSNKKIEMNSEDKFYNEKLKLNQLVQDCRNLGQELYKNRANLEVEEFKYEFKRNMIKSVHHALSELSHSDPKMLQIKYLYRKEDLISQAEEKEKVIDQYAKKVYAKKDLNRIMKKNLMNHMKGFRPGLKMHTSNVREFRELYLPK